MALRWTLALILICLTIFVTLITAFRVRDLPKNSHDSARKQEKCESCDVKSSQKWQSDKTESDKLKFNTPNKIKEGLRVKHSSYLNSAEIKSTSNEDQSEDEGSDFGFLDFQTGFMKEYPKDALNKLEQKLEIISKSFWNLFGNDVSDEEIMEVKDDIDSDEDDEEDADDGIVDNNARENEDNTPKKVSSLKTPKILDTKNKLEPSKRTEYKSKLNIENKPNKKIETMKDLEWKSKLVSLKHKTEIPKYTVYESKYKNSQFSNENDENYSDNDYTEEIISAEKGKTTTQDSKKKSSTEKYILKDVKKSKGDSNEKSSTKITEDFSDKIIIKTNFESKINDQVKIVPKDEKSDNGHDDDDVSDEDDSDEDDKNQKHLGFAPKISSNFKETSKPKDIENNSKFKEMQSSKHIKNRESFHFLPTKDDSNNEGDSTEELKKNLVKSESHQTYSSEIGLNEKNHSLKKKIQKNSEVDKTVHKNVEPKETETQTEVVREESRNKNTTKITATIIPDSKNDINLNLINTIKEEIKSDSKEEGYSKKEFVKPNDEVHDSKTKSKLSKEKKDKKLDTSKINKSGEINKHTNKFDIAKDDLKNKKTKIKEDKQRERESVEQFADSQEVNTKSESNLKHITDALHRRSLLKSEFEDFYTFLPTFAPNFSRVHNPECRRHGQIMLRQLRGTKLWALNMLDATAKIPSGLLQGNGIQLGDFEQCLASRARVQLDTGSVVKIQGKYCLAWIDVRAEHSDLEAPVHLAQAKNLIKSRIDDPGHFVPRFSTLSWGVCVPSPCEPEDVEAILRDAIRHYQRTTGVVVRIKVNEQDCHSEKGGDWWDKWLELPTVLTLSFYGVVIVLVCVATIQDFVSRSKAEEIQNVNKIYDKAERDKKKTKPKEEDSSKQSDDLLSIFSLYHTTKKLTAPGSGDDIPCIHGVRAIATIALLIAHKLIPVATMPYTNRSEITEMLSSAIWSWSRAGWLFTDCFLLLSGALSAYRICNDTETGAPKRLLLRYIRLTPALLAVVLFYAYVWDNISNGPMWGTFVTKNAQVCQEGWWWNLFYVQNYFSFENMCAPQTFHLALDMQLTILGGIIVWLVQEKSGFTKLLLPAIHIVAAYSRYSTVRDHRLTLLAYRGVSVSQLYRTARLSYTSVLHRSTPYLFGLSLGIALKKPSKHGKFFLTVGWMVSGILWCLVWWAGFDSGTSSYRYNVTSAAQYAAFTPIASAIAISWVIYSVHNGCSDFLSQLFSARPLAIISRLSYAIFLCQFIIYITNIGIVKTSSKFSITSLFDIQEISTIILSSAIITLTLIIPMQSLPKCIAKLNITETSTEKNNDNYKLPKDIKNIGKEEPQTKHIQRILVHREFLKEIPEAEIEYEEQRDRSDGLEGILEEEENEDEMDDIESHNHLDDDLVIVEEQGDDESWGDRENEPRAYSREENELDEWEWTANGRNGAQYSRYSR